MMKQAAIKIVSAPGAEALLWEAHAT